MGVKAVWGPKSFYTSPSGIVPLNDFSTSVRLKADSENDTSGTEPTNTRGRELQPLSLSTTYFHSAGVDPMAEFNSWVSLIGLSYPMYMGGRRVGPAQRFQLQGVEASDLQQAENGAVLLLTVSLSFTEYSEGKSSKLANVSGSTNSNAADKAKQVYLDTVKAKQEAKNASASDADRQEKKVSQ